MPKYKQVIPEELTVKRDIIEANFIMCLYKDPCLMDDYKTLDIAEDLMTEDGKFYYSLAFSLKKAGYNVFDQISIHTYLEDKGEIKRKFDERGGYKSIADMMFLLDVENVDSYYDELMKNNFLIRLHLAGFNVMQNLERFSSMSSGEVYEWFDYNLANISVGKIEKTKIEDLSDGYEDWVERVDKGDDIGFPVGSKLLNKQLCGVHRGNLMLYLGGIGQGKSSSAVSLFILPTIQNGNDICIICNEQDSDDYRNMIMSTVLFGKIGNIKGMNRSSFIKGNFDEYEREKIKEAIAWIKAQPGRIKFVGVQDYNVNIVKKIIKRQSKLGCGFFLFDVLKNTNDASDKAWAELSDMAKTLFLTAKNENVAIVANAQLASDSMFRKYLDLSSVGKSRAISETAAQVVGFRPIMDTEITQLKPYKWKKTSEDGPQIKVVSDLNPEDHYIIMFTMKNRFGPTNPQIVMKFNQAFNTLEDIGYVNISYDNFMRK